MEFTWAGRPSGRILPNRIGDCTVEERPFRAARYHEQFRRGFSPSGFL